MTTPPVAHPTRPGVWGVFLPYAAAIPYTPSVWVETWSHRPTPEGRWLIPLWLLDYLRAHEFDVERPFESVAMDNLHGWGYFYL